MTDSLQDKIQRLEDIENIRSLLVEYGQLLDKRELGAYSRLFANDGIWEGGMGKAQTPEGIEKLVRDGFAKLPPRENDYHLMSSVDIKITGSDSATAWQRETGFEHRIQPGRTKFWTNRCNRIRYAGINGIPDVEHLG